MTTPLSLKFTGRTLSYWITSRMRASRYLSDDNCAIRTKDIRIENATRRIMSFHGNKYNSNVFAKKIKTYTSSMCFVYFSACFRKSVFHFHARKSNYEMGFFRRVFPPAELKITNNSVTEGLYHTHKMCYIINKLRCIHTNVYIIWFDAFPLNTQRWPENGSHSSAFAGGNCCS